MKTKCTYVPFIALYCLLIFNHTITAQPIVTNFDIQSAEAHLDMSAETTMSYQVEIAGPDDYYWSNTLEDVQDITITKFDHKGKLFKDGSYSLQITPIFVLAEEHQEAMQFFRENKDESSIIAYRKSHDLFTPVDAFFVNFSIHNGTFVRPQVEEISGNRSDLPTGYDMTTPSSENINPLRTGDYLPQTMDNSPMRSFVQVFAEDVIIQGSICMGFDCNSAESFGFDTQRLKENNLQIHFDDTSASASFPSNDWRIKANDTDNGGANYLAIQNATSGTTPFKVDAGAGNNALIVDGQGDIGIGTGAPVVELHIADGDSPTMRLEQDGSAGFTPQTWDIAGNETNFFVRDVTNGSKLPFKIKPNAPTSSLFISANGDIGIGTENPGNKLHVTGSMTVDGDIVVASDGRFKKEVQNMEAALPIIEALQPKQYAYRTQEFIGTHLPEGKQYGFIAQEIETILPEMVNTHSLQTNAEGETVLYKGLDYSKFVPFVVKAMQEQQATILIQATEIDALKIELTDIREQLKIVTDFIKKQH